MNRIGREMCNNVGRNIRSDARVIPRIIDRVLSDAPGAVGAYYNAYKSYRWAQESPHLSDRPKNVGEERLLPQHLGEALHQRDQPSLTHGWQ